MLFKKSSKAVLYAGHDLFQMRFNHSVIGFAAILLSLEKTALFHEAKVFGGHVALNPARLSQLSNRVGLAQQHLDHTQTVRMSQDTKAFGSLNELVEADEFLL